MITKVESKTINQLRFVCMIFLVMLHTSVDHLLSGDMAQTALEIRQMVIIPFLGILFVLSAYLFFQGMSAVGGGNFLKEYYPQKLKKRVKSLLLPYLIWSIASIVYKRIVAGVEVPSNVIDFITLFWDSGTGHPVGMALWYVKSLIVFSVLSPVYFFAVKYLRHFTIVAVVALCSLELPIDYPFFSVFLLIGAYLALNDISLESISKYLDWRLCLSFYVLFQVVNFIGEWSIIYSVIVVVCMMGIYGAVRNINISATLVGSSTLIYFMHVYFTGIRNILIKIPGATESLPMALMVWMLTATIVIGVCICGFWIAKKTAVTRKLLSISIGDRS